MNIMILLAHPAEGSLNHGIADRARRTLTAMGHNVQFHDLYKERFDPLLPVAELQNDFVPQGLLKEHCDQLQVADGLVIVHPN